MSCPVKYLIYINVVLTGSYNFTVSTIAVVHEPISAIAPKTVLPALAIACAGAGLAATYGSLIDVAIVATTAAGVMAVGLLQAAGCRAAAHEQPDSSGQVPSNRMAALSHRLAEAHPISGLPVREALIAHMNADQAGVLGALAFADTDRLTAFDPALADRIFAISTDRLRRMLPAQRLVAQVDRGHLAIWYGNGDQAEANAELETIVYALSDVIEIDGQSLVPRINIRAARFHAAEGVEATAFLTRTLASFALPTNGPAASPERPMVDYLAQARDKFELEQDLRQAVGRRELELFYQPLIDAARGRVDGAEALLRWEHGQRGPIPPSRFIPIMEATGLASEIGLWVLNSAVREARHWALDGLSGLRVAVNVSGLQLEREDFALFVQRTLQRHELAATGLEIELTESVATTNAEPCRRIFKALRAMGVKLAVDDFGTGYSGFSSLRALEFDKIKIDREFVTDVDARRDSQAICQSIIALGRGLGIRVLAEGVERHEEYAWLRRHGCQHFQGYYFSRPLAGDAFSTFVRDTAQLPELLRLQEDAARIEKRLSA